MDQRYDELYEALSDPQRRQLLFALLEESPRTDTPIDLDALPDAIIADEADRLRYEHGRLPKLAAYGLVEWTPGLNCVEEGPRFDDVRPLLERLADYHRPPRTRQ